MNRRSVLQGLVGVAGLSLFGGASAAATAARSAAATALRRPAAYWRDKVSPAAYAVLFNEATERAGSSPLDHEKRAGTFVCAACHSPLFLSSNKFDSGTGWPSFTHSIEGRTARKNDFKLIALRTEYHCARCGGHQGHVFDDGPAPRGERWCNNGLALAFIPQGQPMPALRG